MGVCVHPLPGLWSGLVVAICLLSDVARAQFSTIINVPPDPAVSAITSNTQLNLFSGGGLPANFIAGDSNTTSTNLELNISGGTVGANMITLPGTALNLSGGLIGQSYTAYGTSLHITGGRIVNQFRSTDSTINMSAGQIDALFNLEGSSVLNLTGGSIGSSFRLWPGATLNMSNGSLGTLAADPNSVVNISGGSIGSTTLDGEVKISGGSYARSFVATHFGHVELAGNEFRLNGTPISGLNAPGDTVGFNLPQSSTLSGTLLDGTPFAFSSWAYDSFAPGVLTLKSETLPLIGPSTIVASLGAAPLGIRQGQTLVIDSGAAVPANFNAGRGSTVNVQPGGSIGTNLEAVTAVVNVNGGTATGVSLYVAGELNVTAGTVGGVLAEGNSKVNVSGGAIGSIDVINGSKLTLSGGSISALYAQSGGTVEMTGGAVGNTVRAFDGSNVAISGGQIGNDFACNSGSTVSVSGGSIGDRLTAASGSLVTISGGSFGDTFKKLAGGTMRLVGGEFNLNGASLLAGSPIGSTGVVTLGATDVLSGVFADGTPFVFSVPDGDALAAVTLAVAQLPAVGPSAINVTNSFAPHGIRGGQTLNVLSGGQLPANFNAGPGSAVKIHSGATVGNNFEVLGGDVEILGGSVGTNFDALRDSVVTILSGGIGASFGAHNGSIVNIHGGSLGASFQAFAGSTVNLFGKEFLLNGVPVSGMTLGDEFLFTARTGTLSGRLADGSLFTIALEASTRAGNVPLISPSALVTLTLVPEPAAAWVWLSCVSVLGGRLRYHWAGERRARCAPNRLQK